MDNCLNRCTHVKPDGTRCRAAVIKGSNLCFYHNPDTEEARREASRRGACTRNARRPHPLTASYVQMLKGATKAGPVLITPLMDAFLKVREGRMDTRTANSLAYLATIMTNMGEVQVAADDGGPPMTDVQRRMPKWEATMRSCLAWGNPQVEEAARSLGITERLHPDDPRMHQLIQRLVDLSKDRYRAVPAPSPPERGGSEG